MISGMRHEAQIVRGLSSFYSSSLFFFSLRHFPLMACLHI